MILTRKHLDRRTFLRGLGTTLALPLLGSMIPAATKTSAAPVRLGFVYVPNGIIMPDWKPAEEGSAYAFTRILKPLEPYRADVLVLSGLAHNNANDLGDGPGDHARAAACFLTGVHAKKTAGADIRNGVSADQLAAQALANELHRWQKSVGHAAADLASLRILPERHQPFDAEERMQVAQAIRSAQMRAALPAAVRQGFSSATRM